MISHTWFRTTLLVAVMAIGPVPVSAQGTACGVSDSDARLDAQRLNYLLSNRDCRFWTELEQGYIRNPRGYARCCR
jgi:hypothetical protein